MSILAPTQEELAEGRKRLERASQFTSKSIKTLRRTGYWRVNEERYLVDSATVPGQTYVASVLWNDKHTVLVDAYCTCPDWDHEDRYPNRTVPYLPIPHKRHSAVQVCKHIAFAAKYSMYIWAQAQMAKALHILEEEPRIEQPEQVEDKEMIQMATAKNVFVISGFSRDGKIHIQVPNKRRVGSEMKKLREVLTAPYYNALKVNEVNPDTGEIVASIPFKPLEVQMRKDTVRARQGQDVVVASIKCRAKGIVFVHGGKTYRREFNQNLTYADNMAKYHAALREKFGTQAPQINRTAISIERYEAEKAKAARLAHLQQAGR